MARGRAPPSRVPPTDSKTECVGISLKSGERLDADVVIIGAGVAPTTEFLKGAFPLEKDGSLVTDEFLAVQGAQDVFAAGPLQRWRGSCWKFDPS